MRVVFAGGGTGGHVCPAVAVARALAGVAPGSEVLFLGSGRPVERRILEPTGLPYEVVPAAPLRNPLRFAWATGRGLLRARALLRAFAPDVVLGLGGFASVPGALAGRWLGVPLALFEPNAIPGRANVVLSRLAREAYVHWPEVAGLACPTVATGAPLNAAARSTLTRAEARARFGLPEDGPALLVMGGSQGARALNRWVEASLPLLRARRVHLLHLAGSEPEAASVRMAATRVGVSAAVLPFLADVGAAYRAADLAVVRGGAATLAELLAAGLPARVVPLAGTADDHQVRNGEAFAALGAGDLLPEPLLEPLAMEATLALLDAPERLAQRRQAALAAARPDAARAVARRLLALAGVEASDEAGAGAAREAHDETMDRSAAAAAGEANRGAARRAA